MNIGNVIFHDEVGFFNIEGPADDQSLNSEKKKEEDSKM